MRKRYGIRFWIIFWLTAALLLTGWYFFLQFKNNGLSALKPAVGLLPAGEETRADIEALLSFGEQFLMKDNTEHTFLVLFQNNWELRPGGGFIGSFGVLTLKNGGIERLEVHDTGNFDGRIPDIHKPPYPMEQYLSIPSWKMRDSNFSPDFPTNAEQAEYFYHLGKGEEAFDGVIGITANVLLNLLEITGPIELANYPGVYDHKNAIYTLEYQVERGFREQDIEKGERKGIMRELGNAVLEKIFPLTLSQKIQLAQIGMENLQSKDVQMYFHDEDLQQKVLDRNWGGALDEKWQNDYLFIVDANLNAYKSDPYIKRSVEYTVDLSGEKPKARLSLSYTHTATEKNWLINDYQSYTRIYTPNGSWLTSLEGGNDETQYGEVFDKKMFGTMVKVPITESRTILYTYTLPETIDAEFYDLKIQKQAGVNDTEYTIRIIDRTGFERTYNTVLDKDFILSE